MHGAKYGIDMRETGSSATYVTITLRNQTCAGAIMDSSSSMTATGLRIEGSPKLAGILAGVDPNDDHGADEESPCTLAPLSPGATAAAKHQLRAGNDGGEHVVFFVETGHAENVVIGLFLDDVDDVIDRNLPDQFSVAVHDRCRQQVAILEIHRDIGPIIPLLVDQHTFYRLAVGFGTDVGHGSSGDIVLNGIHT